MLTSFLSSPHISRANISLALQAYDEARVTKTAEISRRSRNQGVTYQYRNESIKDDGRNLQGIVEWILENSKAIVDWKVEDDIERGLEEIERRARAEHAKEDSNSSQVPQYRGRGWIKVPSMITKLLSFL